MKKRCPSCGCVSEEENFSAVIEEETRYAVCVRMPRGGLAGLYGPVPALKDCLEYYPSSEETIQKVFIVKYVGTRGTIVYFWDTEINEWKPGLQNGRRLEWLL